MTISWKQKQGHANHHLRFCIFTNPHAYVHFGWITSTGLHYIHCTITPFYHLTSDRTKQKHEQTPFTTPARMRDASKLTRTATGHRQSRSPAARGRRVHASSSHAADAGEDPDAAAPRQRAQPAAPLGRGTHLPGQLLQGPVPAVRHHLPLRRRRRLAAGGPIPLLLLVPRAVLHAGPEEPAARRAGGVAPRVVAPGPPLLDGLVDERDEPLHGLHCWTG